MLAKKRLKVTETKIKTILENIGEGVFVIDNKGIIIEFNQAAAQMSGYAPAEMLGKCQLSPVRVDLVPAGYRYQRPQLTMRLGRTIRFAGGDEGGSGVHYLQKPMVLRLPGRYASESDR